MQSYDIPAHAFEEAKNVVRSFRTDQGMVHVKEVVSGSRAADIHSALDARQRDLEQLGGRNFRRASLGRNAACPCGSGRKFKKCCINKAAMVGR